MTYKHILLFAGTTEGRTLANFLEVQGIPFTVYVATEYGADLLKDHTCHVQTQRLEQEQIEAVLRECSDTLVIDATHPFAQVVTKNIKEACNRTQTPYWRIIRPAQQEEDVYRVKSIEEAVAYLETTKGNILLTTGSKELIPFTKLTNYKERLFVRLLPIADNINKCRALGFEGAHLIAMQGPFSITFNYALLEHIGASYLVTKDSGDTGGVEEKIQACLAKGVKVILIERPIVEEGYSVEEAQLYLKKLLDETKGFNEKRGLSERQ